MIDLQLSRPTLIDVLRATGRAHRGLTATTCLCGWKTSSDPLEGLSGRSWLGTAMADEERRAALKQLVREGEEHIFQEAIKAIADWLYENRQLKDDSSWRDAVTILWREASADPPPVATG